MATNVKRDMEKARIAEHIVCEVLNYSTLDYSFEEVGDVEDYFYRGDIKVSDIEDNICFVEVKDDSRIGETKNVLIEVKVWSYKKNKWLHPNIESDYDYYAVIARDKKKIFIMDFNVLKKHYKEGNYYEKAHYDDWGNLDQKTYGRLCPLHLVKKWGGLLYVIEYNENNFPTKIKKI